MVSEPVKNILRGEMSLEDACTENVGNEVSYIETVFVTLWTIKETYFSALVSATALMIMYITSIVFCSAVSYLFCL